MKRALITGGSRGIGKAICIKMASLASGNGELLQFDVSDKEQIKQVLGGRIEANPEKHIEVLVNNAGIRDNSLMAWMGEAQWDHVLKTNLDSFFYVTRLGLSSMLSQRYGRIINIVSLSGIKGSAGQTNYSAAKAGVIGATKALAQEVGRQGITVNALAPGFIKTDMTDGLDEKELKALIPVKRFGLPEEVAHAAAFFASPAAADITGQVLSVNGGLYT